MKRSTAKSIWLGMVLSIVASGAASAQQPFALFIRAKEPVVHRGSEVAIDIVLENVSSHEIAILKTAADFDYTIEVKDANGKTVPKTEYGRKLNDPNTVQVSAASIIVPLNPNEVLGDTILASKIYEMAAPGQYKVRVMKTVPPDIGKGTVSSNTISVTIIP